MMKVFVQMKAFKKWLLEREIALYPGPRTREYRLLARHRSLHPERLWTLLSERQTVKGFITSLKIFH